MTSRSRWFAVITAVALAAISAGAYAFRTRLVAHKPTAPASANEIQEASPATGLTPRAPVDIDQRRRQLIGVRTVEAKRAPLSHTIRTVGVVKYDETRQSEVNVRVEGWIRELFADYTGQLIQRGQPLLTLYSPQILAAENEYLLALQSRDQLQPSQIADARQRADAL